MTGVFSDINTGLIASAVAAGIAMGLAYFAGVRATVRAITAQSRPGLAASLMAIRFTLAAGCFAIAAQFGISALLSSFAGFLLARFLALRYAKDAP